MDYKTKRNTIEGLLDHWEDFFEQASSDGPVTVKDPNRPMSKDWTILSSMSRYPSVLELCRVMGLCQRMAPGHYRHLAGHYRSEWRTTTAQGKVRSPGGKWIVVDQRVRERVVPGWVSARMVDRALDFLVAAWDFKVALELPPALTRKLREFTDQDGTHLTEAA